MSWTVLIVDDEPKIRRGLSRVIEAKGPEFSVVGEAEDGLAALELVGTLQPDIMLVDIKMPIVDGLELISRLNDRSKRRVIVVSGHDEFDYAKQALGLGVFDYLLKPVDERNLLGTMRRAAADLNATRKREDHYERAEALATKNRGALLEGLLRDALKGGLSRLDWDETAALLGLKFENSPQLVLVVPLESAGPLTRPLWADLALGRVADEAFKGFRNLVVSLVEAGRLAILAEENEDSVWSEACDRLEFQARETLGLTLSFDRVPVPGFPESLAAVYDELVSHQEEQSPHATLAVLALNILDRRFKEVDLSLDEVAHELQVSPGHLSRVLKQTTGAAFVDALAKVRVRKAAIYLADPAVKVYEVAERVGYASQHYFSRAFRRVLGIAPSEYRRGIR